MLAACGFSVANEVVSEFKSSSLSECGWFVFGKPRIGTTGLADDTLRLAGKGEAHWYTEGFFDLVAEAGNSSPEAAFLAVN
jgi:hypothetical protein